MYTYKALITYKLLVNYSLKMYEGIIETHKPFVKDAIESGTLQNRVL